MERALPTPATTALPLLSTRLVWVLSVVSVLAVLTGGELMLLAAQPPRNPFADYVVLMPGQTEKTAIEHGFSCAPDYTGATCVDKPSAGPLTEIYLSISPDHLIESVSFIAHSYALRLGDLIALWGKPICEIHGTLVVMVCWPGVYALVPLNGHRDHTYFSPVKLVEFSDYAGRVCPSEVLSPGH